MQIAEGKKANDKKKSMAPIFATHNKERRSGVFNIQRINQRYEKRRRAESGPPYKIL